MSLYVSGWLMGEERFNNFSNMYWDPHLEFFIDTDSKIGVKVHFFNKAGEALLYSIVPEQNRKEFIERYIFAASNFFNYAGFDVVSFCNEYFLNSVCTKDLIKEIKKKFKLKMYVMSYETSTTLAKHMSNMIFFNSWENVGNFKFMINSSKLQ